jgi:hypothetical protein
VISELPERLRARLRVTAGGCWVWTGALNAKGYGKLGGELAHRIVYELLRAPLAEGLELHHRHTCPKACANPEHLQALTRAEHRRLHRRERCHRGHELTADNVIIRSDDGTRRCRRCHNERQRRYDRKRATDA